MLDLIYKIIDLYDPTVGDILRAQATRMRRAHLRDRIYAVRTLDCNWDAVHRMMRP